MHNNIPTQRIFTFCCVQSYYKKFLFLSVFKYVLCLVERGCILQHTIIPSIYTIYFARRRSIFIYFCWKWIAMRDIETIYIHHPIIKKENIKCISLIQKFDVALVLHAIITRKWNVFFFFACTVHPFTKVNF